MHSNKSRAGKKTVIEPQRRHGKERVATVLETAAAVFAEHGYEGATMAEIAARAKSPIGSLYRFFPNKELLAQALMDRYRSRVDEAFGRIDDVAKSGLVNETADALIDFVVDLRREMKAQLALLETRPDASAKRMEFRKAALNRIARILTLLSPALPKRTAADMAIVLLQNIKAMARLKSGEFGTCPGAVEELRFMNRLYLTHKLTS